MDKFIKYPLNIDKSLVNWDSHIMKYGGKQLIEILEKEISLDELIKNKDKYNLDKNDKVKRLKAWLKHNCDADKAREELGFLNVSTVVSFFYKNVGSISAIYKSIDIEPYIEEGEIESRFSFIKYDVIEHENDFVIVESHVDEICWGKIKNYENEKVFKLMNKVFIYKRDDSGNLVKINNESEEGKELIEMKKIIDLIN